MVSTTIGNAVTFTSDPLAFAPHVAALHDDTFVLSWENDSDMFARHLDPLGSFTGGNFLSVLDQTATPLGSPLVVEDNLKRPMLFFNTFPSQTNGDVWFQRLNPDFSPTGNFTTGIATSATDEELVDASPAGTAQTAIVYAVPGGGAGISNVELRFGDSGGGGGTGNPILVGAHANQSQQNAAITNLNNGNVVVAYENFDQSSSARTVRFHIYAPDGTDVSGEKTVPSGANAGFPDVATLKDGSFVVAWQESNGIALAHFSQSGALINNGFQLVPGSSGFTPKITALDDGGWLVAWTQASGTEHNGSPDEDIFLERYDFNGSVADPMHPQIHIAQPGDQGLFNMSMTTLADGRVLLAYSSETGDSTNQTTLDYRIIDPRDPVIFGTKPVNYIVGRPDSTTILGGAGFDSLIGQGGDDALFGNEGTDILSGGAGNDQLFGGDGDDTLDGGEGNDSLNGGAGNDSMLGGDGNDTLDGGAGNDTMIGGAGNDVYIVDSAGDVVVEAANGGIDEVRTSLANYALPANVEILTYTGSAPLAAMGNSMANRLTGTSGADSLDGQAGNDTLDGGAGNDTLLAGTGNDLVFGGAGNDLAYAGDGLDTMYGGAGDDVLVGGTGHDLLEGGDGNDYLYVYNGGGLLYGGNGNDVEVGNLNNDVLIGDAGDDTLYAYGGNDFAYGGDGNDVMYGGDGVDVLVGGAGNDYFDGGTGVNYYFGGNGGGPGTGVGNDTFVLNANPSQQNVQVVQDWTEGLDHVLLTGTGFTSFHDLMAHSYQNGAYLVIQPDANNAIWLNGATAASVTASDFSISS